MIYSTDYWQIKQVCESEAMLAGKGWNTLVMCVGNHFGLFFIGLVSFLHG